VTEERASSRLFARILLLENWARAAGFAAILIAALVCGFMWAISYPPIPRTGPQTKPYNSHASAERQPTKTNQGNALRVPMPIQTEPSSHENPDTERNEGENFEKTANERSLTVATWTIAVVTLLMVFAVGTQAALFVWQLGLMRDGIDDAAAQHVVTSRPFVFIRGYNIYPTSSAPPPIHGEMPPVEFWRVSPVLQNSGRTPTKRMVSFISADLRDTRLPADYDFPDLPFRSASMPPGMRHDPGHSLIGPGVDLHIAPHVLSIAEILAIQAGTKHFYMWGWVDYDDGFKGTKRHRTEFCHFAVVTMNPALPNQGAVIMNLNDRHNASDEECMHPPSPFQPPQPVDTPAHDTLP